LSKKLRSKSNRTLTLDPLYEYDGLIFSDYLSLSKFFQECLEDLETSPFNVVCRFTSDEDIDYLFRLTWSLKNSLLVVEETEIYLDPRSTNYNFLRLVQYGRHNNVSLLCVARRVPEINIKLRAQITSAFSFYQSEPRDLSMLEQYGFDRDEILNLPDHEYVTWHDGQSFDDIKFDN